MHEVYIEDISVLGALMGLEREQKKSRPAVSAGKDMLGDKGVCLVAMISGLTGGDAIMLSKTRSAGEGVLESSQAAISLAK